jgi:hypothetical protein
VGVLFVHGIGRQVRGETLVAFGEPLYKWLVRWLDFITDQWVDQGVQREQLEDWFDRKHKGVSTEDRLRRREALRPLLDRASRKKWDRKRTVEDLAKGLRCDLLTARVLLRDAVLSPVSGESQAPAKAELDLLLLKVNGDVEAASWVLAESFWADSFTPPRFRELALWGFVVLPWTVASHFGTRIRRGLKVVQAASGLGILRCTVPFFAQLLYSPVAMLLVLGVAEFLLAVLLVLALVPLPSVSAFVLSMQQQLAAVIGDSYAIVTRPIQAATIVGQVRRDLRWLTERCRSVVVVAHSQGAAVAHLALRSEVPEQLKLLLTFGSGLRKLEELRLARATRELLAGLLSFAGLVVLVAAAYAWWVATAGWVPTVLAVLGGLLLVGGIVRSTVEVGTPELAYWVRLMKGESSPNPPPAHAIELEDYYASADPVPNGPLFDPGSDDETALESVSVRNRGSVVSDHTTYWNNSDEFVSWVARAIARVGQVSLERTSFRDKSTLDQAPRQRAKRVRWLQGARWLFAAVALLVFVLRRPDLAVLGTWLRQRAIAVVDLVWSSAAAWVKGIVAPVNGATDEALGTLALTGATWLAYRLSGLAWEGWNRWEIRTFFRRGLYNPRSVPFLGFVAWTSATVALGVAVAVDPFWRLLAEWGTAWSAAALLLAGLAVAGLSAIAVVQRQRIERSRFIEETDRLYEPVPAIQADAPVEDGTAKP